MSRAVRPIFLGCLWALVWACGSKSPRTEDRALKVEDRAPKAENREPKTENREPSTEDRALEYLWPADQLAILRAWYAEVGGKRPDESFGELVARIAKLKLGVPYHDAPQTNAPEELRIALDTFQCVSIVESSVAIARCLWTDQPDERCFAREVRAMRYAGGEVKGYASRLHYFNDWLDENARNRRFEMLTAQLGGVGLKQRFDFMTRHLAKYPALAQPEVRAAIESTEARLTSAEHSVIPREKVASVQRELRSGDLLAFVTAKPGLMISHAGIALRAPDGTLRLMHASSHHGRVIITPTELVSYVTRRPERRGIMVARPLAPVVTGPSTAAR